MMKDKDWWLCWRPWTVEELKSERAFNGGLFTIFGMRTRAWRLCDIFFVVARGVCCYFRLSGFVGFPACRNRPDPFHIGRAGLSKGVVISFLFYFFDNK